MMFTNLQNCFQNMMESFERELQWCIDQLQLGLETQNPDSRQGITEHHYNVSKPYCTQKGQNCIQLPECTRVYKHYFGYAGCIQFWPS